MSYIDTFDHEYIGHLGYLPIYHPLEKIKGDGWGKDEFSANPSNLVIGGGGGEHPGLVIHKLESLVARFLADQLSDEEFDNLQDESSYLNDLIFTDGIFEFCGWSVEQYASFHKMTQSNTFFSPLAENELVENWLSKSIGELIYFSLGDLNPEHAKLEQVFASFSIRPTAQNISCLPSGYPPSGGRQVINGEVKWGLNRWEQKNRVKISKIENFVVASEVNDRDGIGLEIYSGEDMLIEIFRDDSKKTRSITLLKEGIDLELVEQAIELFKKEIPAEFLND